MEIAMLRSKHGEGTTSVKVHHQPGGASSFSLGGGYGEDKPKAAVPQVQQPTAQPVEEQKVEESAPTNTANSAN